MRLHNRQVKAAFWTDTELIRLLDLPGRMFYEGLWQLADDSGCLEYDILAFKIQLFPADNEITEDTISCWVQKLIDAKKLIPYEACEKKCLFLKNFHKHQVLKNCPLPDVPLPLWITFESYRSNDRQGRYIVNENLLNDFLQSYNKKNVIDQPLQFSSNQNLNHNLNIEQEPKYIESDSAEANPLQPNNALQNEPQKNNQHDTPQDRIFMHWNGKGIITHRIMSDKIRRAITDALRNYSEDEIYQAIDNYAIILTDDKYFWSYKWTLQKFLQRGLDDFLDFNTAAQNYAIKERASPTTGISMPKNVTKALELVKKAEQEEGKEEYSIW